MKLIEILYPRKNKYLSIDMQILLLVVLFTVCTTTNYLDFQKTGTMFGYPLSVSILFVPIYEELIFRGLLLVGLTKFYSIRNSIIISSVLFGIWHFKNIFYLSTNDLLIQIFYAGLVFGPISALITVKSKNIWLSVMFHYLNNIIAPYSFIILASLVK